MIKYRAPLRSKFFSFCISGALISISLFTGCSLKYANEEPVDSKTPEFVFTNAVFSRYENNSISMELSATTLEQYKKDNASYAENAKFRTWNDKGQLDTTGNCKILSIDNKDELYTLYKDISVNNISNNFYIIAQNLKFNGKTEQLTSGAEDSVYIQRDDVEISGKGFSASGLSRTFTFTSSVEGKIITEDSKPENIINEDESSEIITE